MFLDRQYESTTRNPFAIKEDRIEGGYRSSYSSRLEQLKMNNPFEMMTPKIRIATYCEQIQPKKQKYYRSDMENPFYRKCLIREKEDVYYNDDLFLNNFSAVQKSVDGYGTRTSLKFMPTQSGRIQIIDPIEAIDQGYINKNRFGGDFNSQARFSVEQGQSKLFVDMLESSEHKQKQKVENRTDFLKSKNSNTVLDPPVIEQIQSNSKPTQQQSDKNKQPLMRSQYSNGQMQQIPEQLSNSAASFAHQRLNQVSYYQDSIKVQGKQYYLIPFANQQ